MYKHVGQPEWLPNKQVMARELDCFHSYQQGPDRIQPVEYSSALEPAKCSQISNLSVGFYA
jgi:hypothetical protein